MLRGQRHENHNNQGEIGMKFELGIKAKDKVSGFSGTLTTYVKYLTGCDRYLIEPDVDEDNKYVEGTYFDVDRIVIIE